MTELHEETEKVSFVSFVALQGYVVTHSNNRQLKPQAQTASQGRENSVGFC